MEGCTFWRRMKFRSQIISASDAGFFLIWSFAFATSSGDGSSWISFCKEKDWCKSKKYPNFDHLSNISYFIWVWMEEKKSTILTSSSLSGTLEMKSANSLFEMALGLISFFKNLLQPQAIIRYLEIVIDYRFLFDY